MSYEFKIIKSQKEAKKTFTGIKEFENEGKEFEKEGETDEN